MNQKFYICKHCGNVIEKVEDKGVPVLCCGEVMKELQAGIEDAAFEKHIPVYTVEGDTVHVFVGEVEHPMTAEHWIEWVSLKTDKGIQRKYLKPGEKPSVDFKILEGEEVEEVYAYCNLHGLWKTCCSIYDICLYTKCYYSNDDDFFNKISYNNGFYYD